MGQLASLSPTVFIGTHVDYDTRDQLRALAAKEDRSHLGHPPPRSSP